MSCWNPIGVTKSQQLLAPTEYHDSGLRGLRPAETRTRKRKRTRTRISQSANDKITTGKRGAAEEKGEGAREGGGGAGEGAREGGGGAEGKGEGAREEGK